MAEVNPNEVVMPETLTTAILQELFDAAFMTTRIEKQGDLYVKGEGYGCLVVPTKGGDFVRLLAFFRFKPESTRQARLELADRVHDKMIVVRLTVVNPDDCLFDYYVPVAGGITKKNIVMITKRFLRVIDDAIAQCDTERIIA